MKYSVEEAVANLNKSYMKNSKNEFLVSKAYGGCKIVITGKSKKVRGERTWLGMGSAQADVTYGYMSPKETLAQLGMILSDKEGLKYTIQYWEKVKA